MSTPDPRRGLPSASSIYRLANCPGSLALTQSLRGSGRYYELPNPYAATGTAIHHLLAVEFSESDDAERQIEEAKATLDGEALRVAAKCAELRNNIVNQWSDQVRPGATDFEWIIEKRFWYRQGIFPRFSGQPDFGLIDYTNRRALLINYKTGRIEAEPAADNLQLRTEIVLLKHAEPYLEEVDAVIVEPLVTWDSERVRYGGDELRTAENQILAIVDRAAWERDKRFAGAWCGLCPARANCREALDYIQTIPNPNSGNGIVELPRGERGTDLWEKIKLAKKLLVSLEETYTRILEDEPDALPGFCLPTEGHERRVVPYPSKLKHALIEYLNGDEVDGCAQYYVEKLEELFGMKQRLAGKELERAFTKLTKDVISIVHDRPFIRPMTRRERETAAAKTIEAK